MLTVRFFAILRETLDCDRLELDDVPATVAQLREQLSAKDGHWRDALDRYGKLVAVNQTFVDETHPLTASDEVAFFPPVTGG